MLIGAALLAAAACGPEAEPREAKAITVPEGGYKQRIDALAAKQRDALFLRAIRDAGQECQQVVGSAYNGVHFGMPSWAARCSNGADWLIMLGKGGNARSRPARGEATALSTSSETKILSVPESAVDLELVLARLRTSPARLAACRSIGRRAPFRRPAAAGRASGAGIAGLCASGIGRLHSPPARSGWCCLAASWRASLMCWCPGTRPTWLSPERADLPIPWPPTRWPSASSTGTRSAMAGRRSHRRHRHARIAGPLRLRDEARRPRDAADGPAPAPRPVRAAAGRPGRGPLRPQAPGGNARRTLARRSARRRRLGAHLDRPSRALVRLTFSRRVDYQRSRQP